MSWLPVTVTGQPTADEPVTLAELKAQCRIDGTESDTELNIYLSVAREFVEAYTGTKLRSQTVLMQCSSFYNLDSLPMAPVASVTDVKYLDQGGTEQTLDTSVYDVVLTGLEPLIRRKYNQIWPVHMAGARDAVRVTAIVGYDTVPEPIRAAIMMLVAQWVDERSSISAIRQTPNSDGAIPTLPFTVEALLANYRRF